MLRRQFPTGTATAAADGTPAAPRVAQAQSSFGWKMTNPCGPAAPFDIIGPGSPTEMIVRVDAMSGMRLEIQRLDAGAPIPASKGFDAVQQGVIEMNPANSHIWSGTTFGARYFTTAPFGMGVLGHMA